MSVDDDDLEPPDLPDLLHLPEAFRTVAGGPVTIEYARTAPWWRGWFSRFRYRGKHRA